MESQKVNPIVYEKYEIPYKYEKYEIYDKEENIIDYYRLYYLRYNIVNPIIKDIEDNYPQIISINRHVHILLEHFNISCDVSQCGDGKTRESMAVLATYLYSLKYGKKFLIDEEKVNICVFGPANCKKTWENEASMNFDGIGKVKFFSINTIQGNKKNLPDKNYILGGELVNGKIVYHPGKLLKKLKKKGFNFIFDEFHCSKNNCLSSNVSATITKYINNEGIYTEYNNEIIGKLNKKIEQGKVKYSQMLKEECFKNKIIFMSASLTDKPDMSNILKSLGIIENKLIFGGRGIGSIKNYTELKSFIEKTRKFNRKKTRNIEKEILENKKEILSIDNEKIQKKFSNEKLNILVNELFIRIWIPLLFSHIAPIKDNEFEPEVYNSFHKLKYGNREIIGLSKKLLKQVKGKDSSLRTFGSKIESLELATIPIVEGLTREVLEENSNNRVIIAVPKIIMVNILSKMLSDIDHLIITSEISNKSENVKIFQKNKKNSPRVMIATIKSIHQSIDLGDNDGNYKRYLFCIVTFSVIESFQLIGRVFRKYTTKSKAIVKFIYVISSEVEEFDKDTLINIKSVEELTDKDPIQFSIILSNLNKSKHLEKFVFANNKFLSKNMNFEFNKEPRFPCNKKVYKNYINIRNTELYN